MLLQLDDVATVGLYVEAVHTLAGAGLDVTASPALREGNVLLDTALRQPNAANTDTVRGAFTTAQFMLHNPMVVTFCHICFFYMNQYEVSALIDKTEYQMN